jgi:hypothetical protein
MGRRASPFSSVQARPASSRRHSNAIGLTILAEAIVADSNRKQRVIQVQMSMAQTPKCGSQDKPGTLDLAHRQRGGLQDSQQDGQRIT